MIIYNETIIVEEATAADWLTWVQVNYIPAVIGTGLFQSYQVLNVMDSPNEGITYCIQYNAESLHQVEEFFNTQLDILHQAQQQQFENKFVLFSTLMQTV